ncbi:DMT family transporter [Corynebacterium sp. LK2590]|uniref:DMT family transporter n=1 Tax=unclassified Corynebacterium TaxID=2624378 RepID=UPI0034CE2D88
MLSSLLAIFFALASALTVAWGTVVRHRIALDAPSSVMRTAMTQPLWWVGTFAALAAYGLQVVALGFGTLLIVQPILVMSLMFTLPLAAWYSRRRMSGQEIGWSLVLTVAVGTLIILGRPSAGKPQPAVSDWAPALLVGITVMAVLAFIGWRHRSQRALMLGTICGGIYGYVAVLSKAVVDIFAHSGVGELLTSWEFYALIATAATGTVVQQYSFHAGPLKQSLPAMTIVEPMVAFLLGYAILGEKFQITSAAGWAVMGVALALMIAATIVLSQQSVGSGEKSRSEPR